MSRYEANKANGIKLIENIDDLFSLNDIKIKRIEQNDLHARVVSYFRQHAAQSDNIRCAYIIGSMAQDNSYRDKLSDLDIEIVTNDKNEWLENLNWLDAIAPQELAYLQVPSDGNGMQTRVIFEKMAMVDIVFLNVPEFRQAYKSEQYINGVFGRGVVSIVDKDNLLGDFRNRKLTNVMPDLTEEALKTEHKNILLHLVYAKNKILQGELLVAKDTMDVSVRKSLIKLIRWQENQDDPNKDLWHRARHFEKWASDDNRNIMMAASSGCQRDMMEMSVATTAINAAGLSEKIAQRAGVHLETYPDIRNYLSVRREPYQRNLTRDLTP